jgi:hypothetical protein
MAEGPYSNLAEVLVTETKVLFKIFTFQNKSDNGKIIHVL